MLINLLESMDFWPNDSFKWEWGCYSRLLQLQMTYSNIQHTPVVHRTVKSCRFLCFTYVDHFWLPCFSYFTNLDFCMNILCFREIESQFSTFERTDLFQNQNEILSYRDWTFSIDTTDQKVDRWKSFMICI